MAQLYDPPRTRKLSEWAFALASIGLLYVVICIYPWATHMGPPSIDGRLRMAIYGICAFGAIGFCLWRSASSSLGWRAVYAAVILMSLYFYGFGLEGALYSNGDFLWVGLVCLYLTLAVASWLGRQRWVIIAVPAAAAYALAPSLSPSKNLLPASQIYNGLTVQLQSLTRYDCRFEVLDKSGRPPEGATPIVVAVEPFVGRNLRLRRSKRAFFTHPGYDVSIELPGFAKTADLRLRVSMMQPELRGGFKVLLDGKHAGEVIGSDNGGLKLTTSEAEWNPQRSRLNFTMSYLLPDNSGFESHSIRCYDSAWEDYPISIDHKETTNGLTTLRGHIGAVARTAKWLTVEIEGSKKPRSIGGQFIFRHVPVTPA